MSKRKEVLIELFIRANFRQDIIGEVLNESQENDQRS